MNVMRIFAGVLSVCLMWFVCGCISVSYVPADAEKVYTALGEDDRSEIYYEASAIPGKAGERVFVGSAEAEGSTSFCTLTDIKNKLMDRARKQGANVVLITEILHKESGMVRSDQVKNMDAPTWTPADDSASSVTAQRNMDVYMGNRDPDVPVYEITMKARFYRIPQGLLVKEPLILRGSSKPKRRTAPAKDDRAIRIQ